LRNPLAKVEVYTTICDDQTAPVFLKDGGDWVEYQDPHPVYLEAVRRRPAIDSFDARPSGWRQAGVAEDDTGRKLGSCKRQQ